jgi:hypothetical protein
MIKFGTIGTGRLADGATGARVRTSDYWTGLEFMTGYSCPKQLRAKLVLLTTLILVCDPVW